MSTTPPPGQPPPPPNEPSRPPVSAEQGRHPATQSSGYPTAAESGRYPASPAGYQQYPAQQYAAAGPVNVRRRTGWLLLAQILTVIEAVLGMILGVLIIVIGAAGTSIINSANLSGVSSSVLNAATGILIGFGVVVVLFFLGMLIAGIIAGRPSMPARIIVGVLVIITVLLSLLGISKNFNTTSGAIGTIVFWVWQALILFGMLIHGTRRRVVVPRA